jgi:hypothetical protein
MSLQEFQKIISNKENPNKLSIDETNINDSIPNNSIEIVVGTNYIHNFLNYYQPFKKFGIIFCKIGKTLAFGFDENFYPKFIIGPHWPLFIIMNIIISIMVIVIYKVLLLSFEKKLITIIYLISIILILIFYYITFLINPGIILNKKGDMTNSSYCSSCQCYYNPSLKISHCNYCGVCIEGFDHHCVWIGKCVGKNNKKTFYGLIVSVVLFYIILLYLVIKIYFSKED